MNAFGHLARLALRATQPATGLRPRPLALYEQRASFPEITDRHGEPQQNRAARPGLADRPTAERVENPGAPGRTAAPASSEVTQDPLSVLSRTILDGFAGPPAQSVAVAGSPTAISTPRSTAPADPLDPATAAELVEPRGAALLTRTTDTQRPPAATPAGPDQSPVDSPVGTGPPAAASPSARIDQPPAAVPGVTAALDVPGLPTLSQGPPPPDAAGLPRLHLVRPTEPPPPRPEVTVTIGRIEVLPPAPAKPSSPPAGPRKASTAPKLADYLRDRSGR